MPCSATALSDSKEQHGPVVTAAEGAWTQASAELYVFAEQRGLRLVRADGPNRHLLTQAMVSMVSFFSRLAGTPKDVLQDVGAGPLAGSAETAS